jgi:DNA-binding transcriptional LysR family regulator
LEHLVDFTLRQIQCFVAVADAGQVSLAAGVLKLSQSAITESIQALERRVELKLVARHRRGLRLTREGYQFLHYAHAIVSAVDNAKSVVQSSNLSLRGAIKLGVPPTVTGYFLPAPLTRFQHLYPNLKVQIAELDMTGIERALHRGIIDIAISLLASHLESKQLETVTMFSSPRRLWLSPNHRLASNPKIHLRDLAGEPYLLLSTDNNTETTKRYWSKYKLEPNITLRTISIEAIRNLVARGAGITILSDLVYRPWSLEGQRIEARPLVETLPDLKICLAYKKGRLMSPAALKFRDFFRGDFK